MFIEMAWAEPQHTPADVDAAGMVLIDDTSSQEAFENGLTVLNNWRASHAFPLNTFQTTLRRKARQIDERSIVAQRVKRMSSIDLKLRRYDWLKLSEMQDIGGCRVVVRSVRRVRALVRLYKESDLKHKLDHEDDYIDEPKRSGYRGVHLIYRYHSDKKDTYNSLKIEMQFRSIRQHAWATAVETIGTFIGQALKSSQGEKDWLRFFALMGTRIALRERTPPVPGTPTNKAELVDELLEYTQRLDVVQRLSAYGVALQTLEHPGLKGARYFLLQLDPLAHSLSITGYKWSELERASGEYAEAELRNYGQPGADAVLVSVDSLAILRRAYPNYFLDTRRFLSEVRRAVA